MLHFSTKSNNFWRLDVLIFRKSDRMSTWSILICAELPNVRKNSRHQKKPIGPSQKNPDAWRVAGIVRYSIRESYKNSAQSRIQVFLFNFEALMTRGICLRRQARCGRCEDQGTPGGGQLVLGKMKHHLCHGWRPNIRENLEKKLISWKVKKRKKHVQPVSNLPNCLF